MPDITIPDAAVEAAARNMFDLREIGLDQSPTEWDELPEPWQDEWRDGARAALAAAAPHIAAQVASDIHGQFGVNVSDEMSDWWDGYRQAQRDVLRKLREIEAYYRIEADHG